MLGITSLELLRTLMLCLVQLSKRKEKKAAYAENVSGYVCKHGSPSGERDTV